MSSSWTGSSQPPTQATIPSANSTSGLGPQAAVGGHHQPTVVTQNPSSVVSGQPHPVISATNLAVAQPPLRLVPGSAPTANSSVVSGPAFVAKGAASQSWTSGAPRQPPGALIVAGSGGGGDPSSSRVMIQVAKRVSAVAGSAPSVTAGASQFVGAKPAPGSAPLGGATSAATMFINSAAATASSSSSVVQSVGDTVARKQAQPAGAPAMAAPSHDGAGANQIVVSHSYSSVQQPSQQPIIPMAHSGSAAGSGPSLAAIVAPGHPNATYAVAPPSTGPPPAHQATAPLQLTGAVQLTTVKQVVAGHPATIRSGINIIQETKSIVQQPSQQGHHTIAPASAGGVANAVIMTTQQQQQPSQVTVVANNSLATANSVSTVAQQSTASQQQFQRLKVEDALSYLDQVKYKFNTQPQVYNDFLDIMKEFKSQSIDTPGVIQRVSNLFKGHPELIVGFNTFLPPGYKIEMKAGEAGVSVSMPPNTVFIQSGGLSSTQSNNVPIHFTTTPPSSSAVTSHIVNATVPHVVASNNPSSTVLQLPIGTSKNSAFSATNVVVSGASIQRSLVVPALGQGPPKATIAAVAAAAVESPLANNALHHGSQSAQTNAIQNVAAAANGATSNAGAQPVEFNHAITYVNKIKLRFVTQPEVYKQFLEILHAYQKEQKNIKEGKQPENKSLSEGEVYQQVSKLFQNQEDLLQEFSLFLPDANAATGSGPVFALAPISSGLNLATVSQISGTNSTNNITAISAAQHNIDNLAAAHRAANNDHGAIVKKPLPRSGAPTSHFNQNSGGVHGIQAMKRAGSNQQPFGGISDRKRPKMTSLKDVSMAEAGKYGSLNEFAFFDKVRKALRSTDVYENFLRCFVMYNHEIVSRSELVLLVTPFLAKSPELLKWLKEFLGCKGDGSGSGAYTNSINNSSSNNNPMMEGLPQRVAGMRERERERINAEVGMEIDYATCKRYGASYRALPKNYPQPKCSGRTPLCREVLNDTWVSFPSWSEDSTFVTSKKTQYEEHISKCEDERYELDVVIETNLATIRVLEAVQKKLSRMTPDERNKFKLDDNLGGTSTVIHQRSIRRIYGDKAVEIIEGLKKNPAVAVPLVLRRLKMKEEEWREAQKSFNKIWREQNERYYLKSLDHQGISFKQNDIKNLRSKNLLNEIETLFEERHEQNDEQQNGSGDAAAASGANALTGPHITTTYKDKSMVEEACNLIIHHVKRQTSIHKEDKQKIKQLMRHFVPDLFCVPRGELSDDEFEDMDYDRDDPPRTSKIIAKNNNRNVKNSSTISSHLDTSKATAVSNGPATTSGDNTKSKGENVEDSYALFFVNNNWYLFLRLHAILCERLGRMYERARIIAMEEDRDKRNRKESTAVALRLKPRSEIDTEEYFPAFVDMIKQVLDGNLDGNQYEDLLREMFGIYAYIGFTMDKVVQNIVRQLQHIVCDEACFQCTDLFVEESKASDGLATGGLVTTQHLRVNPELVYQKKAEQILTDENCFKIMFFKREGKITIELLDTDSVESEDGVEIERWSEYIEKYVKEDDTISDDLKERLSKKPVFLPRNIPLWRLKGDRNQDDIIEATSERSNKPKSPHNTSNNANSDKSKEKSGDATSPNNSEKNNNEKPTDLDVSDETQCRFNVNSYKVVFVVDSECYMYRRNSIKKARQSHKRVTQQLNSRFNEFHSKWLEKKADKNDIKNCNDWLLGTIYENQVNSVEKSSADDKTSTSSSTGNRTRKITYDNETVRPYRTYCKYKVESTGS